MDENRGPGVPTLTWVTLGLLAFNWLATTGLAMWETANDGFSKATLTDAGVIGVYAAFPNVLLAFATWVNRHDEDIVLYCLASGILNAFILLTFTLGLVTNSIFALIAFVFGAFGIWPVSWFVLVHVFLITVFRDAKPRPHDDQPPPDDAPDVP